MTDRALAEREPLFATLYSKIGHPSIPPEQVLRALVLQLLYSIRSQRLLMEELDYNLLFRWFVGLSADDPVWDVTVFTKNRERFIDGEVAAHFFAAVVAQARTAGLLSDEHFTIDGTLIEAWAGQKSFQPKDKGGRGTGPPGSSGDFKGQRRRNDTHASTTDLGARLYRKGDRQHARLAYLGHVLSDNRHGLAVGGRTTRHPGYAMSQAKRRLGERGHGWIKTIGLQRKTHQRGRPRVDWAFVFALSVYDLVRLRSLIPTSAP